MAKALRCEDVYKKYKLNKKLVKNWISPFDKALRATRPQFNCKLMRDLVAVMMSHGRLSHLDLPLASQNDLAFRMMSLPKLQGGKKGMKKSCWREITELTYMVANSGQSDNLNTSSDVGSPHAANESWGWLKYTDHRSQITDNALFIMWSKHTLLEHAIIDG